MSQWYALVIIWIYVLLFFVAFAMVFVFPLAPIVLVFVGVAGLGLAAAGFRVISGLQHVLARSALSRGKCPGCGGPLVQTVVSLTPDDMTTCEQCQVVYLPNGVEQHVDSAGP